MNDELSPEVREHREPTYPIAPILLNRWSPRSMTGEPLPDEELFALFEAARWAPSSGNDQPWRFVFARRQNADLFDRFYQLLTPGNQIWAKNAAALVVVISRSVREQTGKASVTHAFDCGAAWENLAIEAAHRGLVAHGMQGFDYALAKSDLAIPDEFTVQAMIAIGRRAPAEQLPEPQRARERPSTRRPLNEIVFEGSFGGSVDGLS